MRFPHRFWTPLQERSDNVLEWLDAIFYYGKESPIVPDRRGPEKSPILRTSENQA